ncbi:MAG: histidine phosphatase family protein [Actinomycetota bacterium]|nr:histidine phosphatase family protein [Actinomycetota bacterium]
MAQQAGQGSAAPIDPAERRVLLVRHGETEWSRDKRHTGLTDVELTAVGEQQARNLAAVFGGLRPAAVWCSPRRRARRTAELAGLPNVVVDDDLREWEYGEYEGLTTAQIRQLRPQWTIWTGDPPGGETASEVSARADRVLQRVLAIPQDGDVVLVGHGHFSRVLAARWLGLPATAGELFALDTATVCVLGFERDHAVLLHWNVPAAAAGAVL